MEKRSKTMDSAVMTFLHLEMARWGKSYAISCCVWSAKDSEILRTLCSESLH